MKKETKKFEKRFIRVRDLIEKKGLRMIHRALSDQYKSVLPHLKNAMPEQYDNVIDTMQSTPILNFYLKFYPLSATLAMMNRKQMLSSKGLQEDDFYMSFFSQKLHDLVATEAGERIVSITMTSKEAMKKAVREIITAGEAEGEGIAKIQERIVSELGKYISGNVGARARAIAQTEVISASNHAVMLAAKSTKLPTKKYWSTSGLPHTRDSHIAMQSYSEAQGGLNLDEVFPNGLMQPGDMAGDPAEVINCRCTLLTEIQ